MKREGFIAVALLAVLTACGGNAAEPTTGPPAASAACGWDLTTQAGRDANVDRLNFLNQWLTENPGVPAPDPTSSAWRGECPSASAVPAPEHEDEAPVD